MKYLSVIIVGRVLQLVVTAVSLYLLTSYLPLAEIAYYGIATSVAALLCTSVSAPMIMYINRKLHGLKSKKLLFATFGYYFKTIIITAIFGLLILFLLKNINIISDKMSNGLILVSILFYISSASSNLFVGLINTIGDQKRFVGYSVAVLMLSCGASVVFTKMMGRGFLQWVMGAIFGQIVISLIVARVLESNTDLVDLKSKTSESSAVGKGEMSKFVFPITISAILGGLVSSWYRILPTTNVSAEDLGVIIGCFIFATGMMNALEQLAAALYQPVFYKRLHSETDEYVVWMEYAVEMVSFFTIGILGYISVCSVISSLILPVKISGETELVFLCGVSEFVRILGNVFVLRCHASMKTWRLVGPNMISVICLWVSFSIYHYITGCHFVSKVGIVVITMVANLVYLISNMKVSGLRLILGSVFLNRKVIASACLGGASFIGLRLVGLGYQNSRKEALLTLSLSFLLFPLVWIVVNSPQRLRKLIYYKLIN